MRPAARVNDRAGADRVWLSPTASGRFAGPEKHMWKSTHSRGQWRDMQNWVGIAIWIVMGAVIGLTMKALIKRPEETQGHTVVLAVLGSFAAVIGGMLGVGIFHLYEPLALSAGGMAGGAVFSAMMTFVYRWGIRGLI